MRVSSSTCIVLTKEPNVFKMVPTASVAEFKNTGFGLVFKAGEVTGDLLTISGLTDQPSVSNALWLVADEKFPSKRLEVTQGDYLRFGAQVLRVSRLRSQSPVLSADQQLQLQRQKDIVKRIKFNDFRGPISVTSISEFITGSEVCRVCLEGGPELERDLCKCNSLKLAHKDCLRSWVFAKLGVKINSRVTFYDFSKLTCHQCHQRLNFNFAIEEITELVSRPHVMFEVFAPGNGSVGSAFCVEFMDRDDQFITVGRSKRNDIVLKDLTVSREHAKFWWDDGHLYLYDNNSLYGTAGLVSGETDLLQLSQFKLSIGPYLVRIQLETVDFQQNCAKVGCTKSKQRETHFRLPKAMFRGQSMQLLNDPLETTRFVADISCNATQPALAESEVIFTSNNRTESAITEIKRTSFVPQKEDLRAKENKAHQQQSKHSIPPLPPTNELFRKEFVERQKRPRTEYPLIVKSHLNTVRMQLLASKQRKQDQTAVLPQTAQTLLSWNEIQEKRSKGPLSIAELLDSVVISPRRESEGDGCSPVLRRANCAVRNEG